MFGVICLVLSYIIFLDGVFGFGSQKPSLGDMFFLAQILNTPPPKKKNQNLKSVGIWRFFYYKLCLPLNASTDPPKNIGKVAHVQVQ